MTLLQAVRTGGVSSSWGKQGINPTNEKPTLPWKEIQEIAQSVEDRVSINFSSKGEK